MSDFKKYLNRILAEQKRQQQVSVEIQELVEEKQEPVQVFSEPEVVVEEAPKKKERKKKEDNFLLGHEDDENI